LNDLLLSTIWIASLILWIQHSAVFLTLVALHLSLTLAINITYWTPWWSFLFNDFWRLRSLAWWTVTHRWMSNLNVVTRVALMLLENLVAGHLSRHHSLILICLHLIYHHFRFQTLVYQMVVLWNLHAPGKTLLNKWTSTSHIRSRRGFLLICNFARWWGNRPTRLWWLHKSLILLHS